MNAPQQDPAHFAIATLVEFITDEDGRARFIEDPERTVGEIVEDLGIEFPPAVLDTFRALTPEQLDIVARINTTLMEHGLRQVYEVPGRAPATMSYY